MVINSIKLQICHFWQISSFWDGERFWFCFYNRFWTQVQNFDFGHLKLKLKSEMVKLHDNSDV